MSLIHMLIDMSGWLVCVALWWKWMDAEYDKNALLAALNWELSKLEDEGKNKQATQRMNDELLRQGLHEAFCIVRDSSVEKAGDCNCRLRNPKPAPEAQDGPTDRYGWELLLKINGKEMVSREEAESNFNAFLEGQDERCADIAHTNANLTAENIQLYRQVGTLEAQLQTANKALEDALEEANQSRHLSVVNIKTIIRKALGEES